MKKLLMVIMVSLLSALSLTAQTVTLTFNGANKNKNYQVAIDGTSYYSNSVADANTTNTTTGRKIAITNLAPGAHTLAVYRLRNNSGVYNNGSGAATGRAMYTNNIQLRQGYDMKIAVNGNGGVSLTETRIRGGNRNRGNRETISPMATATFDQLLRSVRGRYLQSQKLSAISNAFNTSGNYFTTAQVRSLLVLISSEQNRLALAKLSYSKVTDPTNFTSLYDVFPSIAIRDDMNAYIRNNPNYNNSGTYTGNTNTPPVNNNMPMADYTFSQFLQNLGTQSNDAMRVNVAREAFNNISNRFTTAQIRQTLLTVYGESDRLTMAKLAYPRVYDQNSFFTLYDLISSDAGKYELNNFVLQNGGKGATVVNNTTTRTPMDDATFTRLFQQAGGHLLPWNKVKDETEFFNNTGYYFSVAQINQLLSVIGNETDKLGLAKLAWSRVTDPANFTQTINLFASQSDRDGLTAYIQSRPY